MRGWCFLSTPVATVNPTQLSIACESVDDHGDGRSPQVDLIRGGRLFRSRAALQAKVLALRHQLNVLKGRAAKRVTVSYIAWCWRALSPGSQYDGRYTLQRVTVQTSQIIGALIHSTGQGGPANPSRNLPQMHIGSIAV
jgi:hypothetical protein